MTEPSPNPAQSPVPPPVPPGLPHQPEPWPAGTASYPPGTQPSGPAETPSYPPGTQPPYPPGTQPSYSAGFPGQPTAYPVSAMPASAMPASAMPASAMPVSSYPAVYLAPAPRVSPWIWVLAGVSFVLLLAVSGLGATYLDARNRIADLEQTVAEVQEERDELRLDLEDAQLCVDAFDDWFAAPVGQDEDEWRSLLRACR